MSHLIALRTSFFNVRTEYLNYNDCRSKFWTLNVNEGVIQHQANQANNSKAYFDCFMIIYRVVPKK